MDNEDDDHVGRYVNTPVVVEDMIAIVEALGEWREKKAQEEVKLLTVTQRAAALERTKWRKGKEKVLYWGYISALRNQWEDQLTPIVSHMVPF